jgi:hypothetical protein
LDNHGCVMIGSMYVCVFANGYDIAHCFIMLRCSPSYPKKGS